MKVLCFVTSRPSYSRIKTVLSGFNSLGINYGVVCMASATESLFGNVSNDIEVDGYPVAYRISTQLNSLTGVAAAKTTSLSLLSAADIIHVEKPAAVITVADRYETIATAIAASYQNVPCIHIQGGEVTGNIDDKVRDAVSALSDLHFPATKRSADRLKKFVKYPSLVFNYGCPSVDLYVGAPQMRKSEVISQMLEKSVGFNIDSADDYYVVMMHSDTKNIEEAELFVKNLLHSCSKLKQSLVWFWPNSDPGSDLVSKAVRVYREARPDSRIRLVKNLDHNLFINLLRHSCGLIGNSSVGVREAGVLGLPTVDIGLRQANRERHQNVVNLGYSSTVEEIVQALNRERCDPCFIYGSGNAGARIAAEIKIYLTERYAC